MHIYKLGWLQTIRGGLWYIILPTGPNKKLSPLRCTMGILEKISFSAFPLLA